MSNYSFIEVKLSQLCGLGTSASAALSRITSLQRNQTEHISPSAPQFILNQLKTARVCIYTQFKLNYLPTTIFSDKSFFAVVAAMFIGGASAFTGTATLGIGAGTTSCGCAPSNGPFEITNPAALVNSNVCCNAQVTLTFGDESTTAVFGAIYNSGAGTDNIVLSPRAYAVLAPGSGGTSLESFTCLSKSVHTSCCCAEWCWL
ncbi:hypothetical protein C8R44DRAFT_743087 [Mycena epipterygia]|nr:hypothetical protein C8R44DRAFT_743087 [Mycena epipterygia]